MASRIILSDGLRRPVSQAGLPRCMGDTARSACAKHQYATPASRPAPVRSTRRGAWRKKSSGSMWPRDPGLRLEPVGQPRRAWCPGNPSARVARGRIARRRSARRLLADAIDARGHRSAQDCMDEYPRPTEKEEIRAREAGQATRRTVGRLMLSVKRR
jgi:hypothetical protein